MKIVLLTLAVLLVLFVAYLGIRLSHTISLSKGLIEEAIPYQNLSTNHEKTLLVVGDSTAVGVGANKPEDSIAGRVASIIGATYVENLGVSGAQVHDLPAEIKQARLQAYDVIVVQIGANDITRLHSPTKTASALVTILATLPHASKVIVMSAGDVGSATAIPWVFRGLYTHETLAYHAAFTIALTSAGYMYVNLYNAPRNYLFKEQPGTYLASDGFHPSSAGYAIWFEAVAPVLAK